MPTIILKKKAEVLAEFAMPETSAFCHIGSGSANDVVVADKAVSMQHLHIERRGAQYFVCDLKSAYGTFLNGIRINSATAIHDGDAIGLGDHTVLFRLAEQLPLQSQNHVDGKNSERVVEVRVAGNAVPVPQDFEAVAEPSDVERLRRLQTEAENEVEVDSLEKELAEVIEQTTPEPEAATTAGSAKKSPYYLLVVHGPYLGKKFQLNLGETKIGRDARLNDIVIRETRSGEVDPSVSRRHATIAYRQNNFYLSDKRSKSRTYLNQGRLAENDEAVMSPGDEVEIVSDRQSTIFRFVAESNWDFSMPRRAGAWWLRFRSQALALGCLLISILGTALGIYAWYNHSIAADAPATIELAHQLFAKAGTGGEDEPATPQNTRAAFAPLPTLLHLNGDTYTDLAFLHAEGTLSVLNGKTRRRLWQFDAMTLDRNYPAVAADLNGNRKADLVALTADGRLVAIDGWHGAEIWTSPLLAHELIGPPVVGNFDSDGRPDVAVVGVQGKLIIGYARRQDPEWVEIDTGLIVQAPLACVDLDGDGVDEILVGTERGLVLIYDGSERRLRGSVNINLSLNKLRGRFDESNQIRHPVSAADCNGDGHPDLVVSSRQGNLVCLDLGMASAGNGIKTRELWWANLATPDDSLNEYSYPFALGDIDGNGFADVVAADARGTISAFRGIAREGQQQTPLWRVEGNPLIQTPILFDFDHDGCMEVVAADSNGWVKILDGKSGGLRCQAREAMVAPREAPLLADLDDQAAADLVVVSAEGNVHAFQSNRRIPAGSLIWAQRFGGARHLSICALAQFPTQLWTASWIACLVAVAGINIWNGWIRLRRRRFAKS